MYSTSKSRLRRQIAVVIPCFRVRTHILEVLAGIGDIVDTVYCVDDACPEQSGKFIEEHCSDPRVRVIRHDRNRGVGGATLTGYKAALGGGADIIVKLDGDGQMDADLIELFVAPIAEGAADYAKGNRFHTFEDTRGMPRMRLFGNACLSFMTKLSSGYWNIFDPTNGYTAIDRALAERIVLQNVARRYFFESDMLFYLYLDRAVVVDVPIPSRYGSEISNLKIRRIVGSFAYLNFRNGLDQWILSAHTGEPATAGTVMLSAMPIIVGVQLCLSAINYDIQSVPRMVRHRQLRILAARSRTDHSLSATPKPERSPQPFERADA
jgi:dolichol-phosphate mannosyltransferase